MVKRFSDYENGLEVSSLMFYDVKLPSRHLGVIEEVFTKEEYRQQGRSRKLMLQAIEYARELGCNCVELTVRQDKPHIQNFYKSLGFKDRLNHAYRYEL